MNDSSIFFGHDTLSPNETRNSLGSFGTFALWFSGNTVVTTILTGMLLVPDLRFTTAITLVLIGSLIGAIPLILFGLMGQRTGLPSMVLSRRAYGIHGSQLISIINMCILIAWSCIQALLAGMSIDYAIQSTFGYSNLPLFVILSETIVVLVVLRGHLGIELVERWVALAMAALTIVVFYQLNKHYDMSVLFKMPVESRNGITLGIAFDIIIGTAFSWISTAADYNRSCKTSKIALWGTYLGYILATIVAMGLGATISGLSILNGIKQTYDPTYLLANFGYGLPAALVIFFSVMTTNIMAVYSATLSCMNISPNMSFWKPALIIGVITIFGALIPGILDQFQNFLLIIGGLFVPAFSVIIVDYYFVSQEGYNRHLLDSKYQLGRPTAKIAIGAYIVGAALAAYWTILSPNSFGASLPVFIITGLLYWLGVTIFTRSNNVTSATQKAPKP